MISHKPVISGNYFDKYGSKNPIIRLLMYRYRVAFKNYLKKIDFSTVLEIGSGEGNLLKFIIEEKFKSTVFASDLDFKMVKKASLENDMGKWLLCDGLELPFFFRTFDLVIACEVLEHVTNPINVLEEMSRVSSKWILISVPLEPWWRIVNFARLKYLSSLGNTPGHINHWTKNQIANIVSKQMKIIDIKTIFPWTFILAENNILPKYY